MMMMQICQNLVFAQYLENDRQNETKHIMIDKIYTDIVNFCKFATELLPLINVRIRFLLNILRMN